MDRELLGELLRLLDRPWAEARSTDARIARLLDDEVARVRAPITSSPQEREVDADGNPLVRPADVEPSRNVRAVPELRRLVRAAETLELSRIAGWSEEATAAILEGDERESELQRAQAVAQRMPAPERSTLTLSLALHQTLGRRASAVESLMREAGGRLDAASVARLPPQAFIEAAASVDGVSADKARAAHRLAGRMRPHARAAAFVERDVAVGRSLLSQTDDNSKQELARLARRYRHLGLDTLLAPSPEAPSRPVDDALAREALRRLQQFAAAHASRADSPSFDDAVTDLGFSEEDENRVAAQLKVERRMVALGDSLEVGDALLSAGYNSSRHVAAAGTRGLRGAGLAPLDADRTHTRARRVLGTMASRVGAELDVVGSEFWNLPVGNLSQEPSNLAELPGYGDLFGQQGQCRCDHCRSVLSPAAYFADLMCFIKEQVTDVVFQNVRLNHALKLTNRRPDLLSMPLSCEATNTELPYLQIVNEVLERAVADDGNVDLEDVYQVTLPAAVNSLAQPYDRWFDEATVALSHFDLTWAEVAESVGHASNARLWFGASPAQWALITSAAESEVGAVFGLAVASGTVEPFEPSILMDRLGVSRDTLDRLFRTQGVAAASPQAEIEAELSTPGNLQPDRERVLKLTVGGLDYLHRFERLRRLTSWEIGELDLLIQHVSEGTTVLSEASLSQLARLARVQKTLGASVEETLLLVGAVSSLEGSNETLLGRLLHSSAGPTLPSTRVTMVLNPTNSAERALWSRIQGATGLTAEELRSLVATARLEGTMVDGFPASVGNLTRLIRLAIVARRLSWSIPQLSSAMALTPAVETMDSLGDIEAIVNTWRRLAGADPELVARPMTAPWFAADRRPLERVLGGLSEAQHSATVVGAVTTLAQAHPAAFGVGVGTDVTPQLCSRVAWVAAQATAADAKAIDGFTGAVEILLAEDSDRDDLAMALVGLTGANSDIIGGVLRRGTDPWADRWGLWAETLKTQKTLAPVGAQIGVFEDLVSDAPADVRDGAQALWAAMRARYAEESKWLEVYEPYRDALLGRRRDALVAYLVHTHEERFDSANALYHYYLLDPLMDGCARTSRVVAGTGSLQLYVQRVRMNLERSSTGVPVSVSPELVTEDEWSWRRNYRVWEANRKVFLWPENWLDPELRFNKTPAFETLERELKSGTVDEDTVRDAYAAYLSEFERISTLRHAGSIHEFGEDGDDVLHLFGVTRGKTPEYYYRRIENAHAGLADEGVGTDWGVWERLDFQIGSQRVSPVVVGGRLLLFWVTYVTQPKTHFEDGNSSFEGYKHKVRVSYTKRRVDGGWEPPREVRLGEWSTIHDPPVGTGVQQDPQGLHQEPREEYTLSGRQWGRVFPIPASDGRLALRIGLPTQSWSSLVGWMDFATDTLNFEGLWSLDDVAEGLEQGKTVSGVQNSVRQVLEAAFPIVPTTDPYTRAHERTDTESWPSSFALRIMEIPGTRPDTVDPINGSHSDLIVHTEHDLLYLQRVSEDGFGRYALRRLNTSLASELRQLLTTGGMDALLSYETQAALTENSDGYALLGPVIKDFSAIVGHAPDYLAAAGVYLREIFFHIPRLVARSLNASGHYEEAQRWYHHVFDPTAAETTGTSEAGHPNDRVWRYREFRAATMESLLARLSDPEALAVHENDPLNPHGIAAHRPTAYQKAVFMDYVDNLLDWGDELFGRDTRESVREATLLYVLAQDLLGERPVELGACPEPETRSSEVTFEGIECDSGSPFLVALEDTSSGQQEATEPRPSDFAVLADHLMKEGRHRVPRTTVADPFARPVRGAKSAQRWLSRLTEQLNPLFCVPRNDELDRYWDRVEDRLYKVRHCMSLSGVRRQLALFAPPIDPALLIRARKNGLDLSSVGDLKPTTPLRFSAQLQRAKELASLAQSLGSSFRNALERRDAEELAQLQQVHRANILTLTTRQLERELQLAQLAKASLAGQVEQAAYRLDHYEMLIETGSLPSEARRDRAASEARTHRKVAAVYDALSALTYLIPQAGAPTALKYGGKEIGDYLGKFGGLYKTFATAQELDSARAASRASLERRDQGWEFQRGQAKHQLNLLQRDLPAADIRIERAEHVLALHDREIAHHDEVMTLLDERFVNADRLEYLADQLQSLYRKVFELALKAAHGAQEAFVYERADESQAGELEQSDFIASNYWAAAHRGMLAGEQLAVDLARMEQAYLDTEVRSHELTQTFSLAQLDPEQLLNLKGETATAADFAIPEWAFDMAYPGHYRRRLKSVRITIPCVAGNYTNVSATLTLTDSEVRVNALDPARTPVGTASVSSIATSSGQADPGVFELSFRDARYLPFEGAGAISTWTLELPKHFRAFDYSSINDVLIHLSYTALYDDGLRGKVEEDLEEAEISLAHRLRDTPVYRLISLRQEFSQAYQRLKAGAGPVDITLTDRHFPLPLLGKPLVAEELYLLIERSAADENSEGPPLPKGLAFDGLASSPDAIGGLDGTKVELPATFSLKGQHTLSLADMTGIGDVFIYIKYSLGTV